MFSPLKLSISPLVQFNISPLLNPSQDQVNNYQVTCSSKQDIQPVKRDKAKASMTAKERLNLWKRFQNIDMTEYQNQGKAMQILNSNLSYVRFPRVDNDIPRPVHANNGIPHSHPDYADYDIPRPHPAYAGKDISRSHPDYADYDIPRPHPAYSINGHNPR